MNIYQHKETKEQLAFINVDKKEISGKLCIVYIYQSLTTGNEFIRIPQSINDDFDSNFVLVENKENKKLCPACGYDRFSLFRSLNYKMCLDCGHKIDWFLKEKQQPLIKVTR